MICRGWTFCTATTVPTGPARRGLLTPAPWVGSWTDLVAAVRRPTSDQHCGRLAGAAPRAAWLRKVAERLESRRFDLAATMILEVGKPWREADADVTEAIDHCRYYAQQIEHMEARPRLRNIPGEDNMLT